MEVLKNLSKRELFDLHAQFDEPLDREQFEVVLSKAVANKPHIDIRKLRLQELFNDIDINGDKTVSWDEFTMFIIDAAANDAKIASSASDAILKQYRPKATLPLDVPGCVASFTYMKDWGKCCKIVRREKYSKAVITSTRVGLQTWAETPRCESAILCSEYIPPSNKLSNSGCLVLSQNDSTIRFFDTIRPAATSHGGTPVLKLRKTITLAESQPVVRWSGKQYSRLFAASRIGVVSVINPDEALPVGRDRLHDSAITDLALTGGCLYTASVDSTIKCVDLNKGQIKQVIDRDMHTQGVFQLGVSEYYHQLFSVGLEPWIFVHSLSNDKMKPQRLEDKHRPHHGRVLSLECVDDSPQIITGDSTGLVKVWDLRTLQCVQTISSTREDHPGTGMLSSMGYISRDGIRRMVVNGRDQKIYDYDSATEPHLSDDAHCTLMLFNPSSRSFLTVHRTNVKLWDGQTGCLRGVHNNIVSAEITAICLGLPRMRKFIVGTSDGTVAQFGYAMCVPLGEHPPHKTNPNPSVVGVVYLDGFKDNHNPYILCAYKARVTLIADTEEHVTRSNLPLHCFDSYLEHSPARCMAITESCNVIVGTETGKILVCDLTSFTISFEYGGKGLRGDIGCLACYPSIATECENDTKKSVTESSHQRREMEALEHTLKTGSKPPVFDHIPDLSPERAHRRASLAQLGTPAEVSLGLPAAAPSDPKTTHANERRHVIGGGVVFAADSVGTVTAVLMHSSQALETLCHWKNIDWNRRIKRRTARLEAKKKLEEEEDFLSASLSPTKRQQKKDGAPHKVPTKLLQGFQFGHDCNDPDAHLDASDPDADGDDNDESVIAKDATVTTESMAGAKNVSLSTGPASMCVNPSMTTATGASPLLPSMVNGGSSAFASGGSATSPPQAPSPSQTSVKFAPGPPQEKEDPAQRLLGSRPSSAVAAYFKKEFDVKFAPVVTSLCFLADANILVTGDERGFLTTWDVFGIVSKAVRCAGRGEDVPLNDRRLSMTSVAPAPISAWQGHNDEVLSICSVFGDRPESGAMFVSLSTDRQVLLWSTDGICLGNMAQGRVPDAPESGGGGIRNFVLDKPPADSWERTSRIAKEHHLEIEAINKMKQTVKTHRRNSFVQMAGEDAVGKSATEVGLAAAANVIRSRRRSVPTVSFERERSNSCSSGLNDSSTAPSEHHDAPLPVNSSALGVSSTSTPSPQAQGLGMSNLGALSHSVNDESSFFMTQPEGISSIGGPKQNFSSPFGDDSDDDSDVNAPFPQRMNGILDPSRTTLPFAKLKKEVKKSYLTHRALPPQPNSARVTREERGEPRHPYSHSHGGHNNTHQTASNAGIPRPPRSQASATPPPQTARSSATGVSRAPSAAQHQTTEKASTVPTLPRIAGAQPNDATTMMDPIQQQLKRLKDREQNLRNKKELAKFSNNTRKCLQELGYDDSPLDSVEMKRLRKSGRVVIKPGGGGGGGAGTPRDDREPSTRAL